jgi:radical SAM superfamily enzyme YgiQ (UPF0313 family)
MISLDFGDVLMKIGLLTSIREDHVLPGENFLKRHMTNLAPLYLASFLEKSRLPVEVIVRDRLEDLMADRPEILGISSVTENWEFAKETARRAKDLWNPLTVIGGVHITSLPRTLPKVFDLGVVGEGEETFAALVEKILQARGLPSRRDLAGIPGIAFHGEEEVQVTPYRKGLKNLDEIPLLARERFIKKMGTTYLMTSRGCPYTCNFCVIPNISEGYRKHSPEYVLDEIRSIKRHFPEVKSLRIFDDLYIVDRKRVARIAELVDAEGLNRELSFGCWGRANLMDAEMMKILVKMNMLYVAFGAESGSSRVLSQVKPGVSVELNQQVIDRLYDSGVRVSASFILGHPLETEDDLWATYEFIEKNVEKLFEIEFNVAIPWPGTELWRIAKTRGLVQDDMDFSSLKECAYFPNYCTERYPYLNDRIPPERFDTILHEFKKLFWKMVGGMSRSGVDRAVNPSHEIAELY